MKIVLTGAAGMVGSRFFDLLKGKYDITPLSGSFGIDITDKNKVWRYLDNSKPTFIIHMAAATNVDGCEEDKLEDTKKLEKTKVLKDDEISFEEIDASVWKNSTSAFGVNVIGTKNLSDWAQKHGVKIIYISTDFVFNGENDQPYVEEDIPSPINWYGQTKLWGERVLPREATITRISYPFGFRSTAKKDLIWTLVDLLSKNSPLTLIADQIITPTFIDDIVNALDFLIKQGTTGVINVVGNNFLSPYELGISLAREFGYSDDKINTTTRAKFYKGRAARPFKMKLENAKLRALGFEMTDFFEVLKKIKQ